jgi:hypothetical protein
MEGPSMNANFLPTRKAIESVRGDDPRVIVIFAVGKYCQAYDRDAERIVRAAPPIPIVTIGGRLVARIDTDNLPAQIEYLKTIGVRVKVIAAAAGEQLTNAYLAGAASDLLAALLDAEKCISNGIERGYLCMNTDAKTLATVKAAIAKAKGE